MLSYSLVIGNGLTADLQTFFKGMLVTILFVFLFSALGYLVGTLIHLSKMFIVLLPVLLLGLIFISFRAEQAGQVNPLASLFNFYFQESVFLLLFIKVVITSGLLFLSTMLLSHRLEVR